MRKGGFNVYLMKEKKNTTLYREYVPQFPKHQEVEVQAYVANIIGNDISKRMKTTVRGMSGMIVHGFSKGDK